MSIANQDIRNEIAKNNLKYWQVAQAIGINDGNFSRLLRAELSDNRKKEILQTIKKISGEK